MFRDVQIMVSAGTEIKIRFVGTVEIGTSGHKKTEPIGETKANLFVKIGVRGIKNFQSL